MRGEAAPEPDGRSAAEMGVASDVAVARMCFTLARGRPGASVWAARRTTWTTDAEELQRLVATRAAGTFAVLDWKGKRTGVFDAMGLMGGRASDEAPLATGGVHGDDACSGLEGDEEAACRRVMGDCTLAVAPVSPPDPDEPPVVRTGGACAQDGVLLADLDGDGASEAWDVAPLLDDSSSPVEELEGRAAVQLPCQPQFAAEQILAAGEPRHFNGIDLIGVADLDGDGRFELVLQFNYPNGSGWVIYTTDRTNPRTLRLAAESPVAVR